MRPLSANSVFEDRKPRLADLDGDGTDEIIVVRSYLDRGAALSIVKLKAEGLEIVAETPAIGRANRWLNPAGIAVLVITSGEIDSPLFMVIVLGLVLLMGAIDLLVFSNIGRLSKHLDPSRMVVTEVVFGVLLAALAVELVLNGFIESSLGAILFGG